MPVGLRTAGRTLVALLAGVAWLVGGAVRIVAWAAVILVWGILFG